jgi:NMD protein affecting ribosome stability and mRNA decay
MPRFCPTCGNSSDKVRFLGNFCESCAKAKLLSALPKSVDITICKRCGRIKAGKSFAEPSGRNLEVAIRPQFGRCKVHLIDYDDASAMLDVSDDTMHGTLSVETKVEIVQKKALCDVCYKKACNYYEAVIQLRGNGHKISKFIERITRFFDLNNEFVTRIERESSGGYDVYLSSKRLAQAYLSRSGLHSTNSYTLAGVKNGKRIYKNTYAVRYE